MAGLHAFVRVLLTIPRIAAEGRRVVAIDLPGFGASDMPRDEISIEGYGRTVAALCDLLDLGQVVVVGHSMGGFVAAEVAIQYPERVERLVLQAAAGISTNDVQREPLLAGARVVGALGSRAAASSRAVATRPRLRYLALQTVMRHPSRMPADFVYELIAHSGREGFLPALHGILSYDFRDRLSQIDCPTLVVWGADDMLVPTADADEYERRDPRRAQDRVRRHRPLADDRAAADVQRLPGRLPRRGQGGAAERGRARAGEGRARRDAAGRGRHAERLGRPGASARISS